MIVTQLYILMGHIILIVIGLNKVMPLVKIISNMISGWLMGWLWPNVWSCSSAVALGEFQVGCQYLLGYDTSPFLWSMTSMLSLNGDLC